MPDTRWRASASNLWHSAFRVPHSAFRIPRSEHSAFRISPSSRCSGGLPALREAALLATPAPALRVRRRYIQSLPPPFRIPHSELTTFPIRSLADAAIPFPPQRSLRPTAPCRNASPSTSAHVSLRQVPALSGAATRRFWVSGQPPAPARGARERALPPALPWHQSPPATCRSLRPFRSPLAPVGPGCLTYLSTTPLSRVCPSPTQLSSPARQARGDLSRPNHLSLVPSLRGLRASA